MQDKNYKFSTKISDAHAQIESAIRDAINGDMTNELVRLLRSFLNKNPQIFAKIGGLKSILHIVKHKIDDDHTKIIKEFVIKSIVHNSKERAVRMALASCLDGQYSEYHLWNPGPIRLYMPYHDNTPYIKSDGYLASGKNKARNDWNQFDASWIWDDSCIYLWHRWVENENEADYVRHELQNIISTLKTCQKSLYGDMSAKFLFLVHGAIDTKNEKTRDVIIFNNPWSVNEMLAKFN